ncbi:MAG: (2E,6E)-farnesyl diphosphate synthase [Steroidobacteraceae bacterium]
MNSTASNPSMPGDLQRMAQLQARAEQALQRCLRLSDPGTPRLLEAMRYSVLGGGKRLRPILVYSTGEALGATLASLDGPAASVELIHAYSLVHDDLPAMDDDDLRRGQPTCHKQFDEGTAVLVGDALQALAFAVIVDEQSAPGISSANRVRMIRTLAQGIGTGGMAGGQAIDLEAVGHTLEASAIETMHRKKTGALIQTSVLLGAIAAGVEDGPALAALAHFGAEIGLAFQIQDDILDVEGDAATLGKHTGADAARAKPTYPSALGLDESRRRARAHRDSAVAAITGLAPLGAGATALTALAHLVVDRSH